jgi:hypothetical protein
MSQPPLNSLPYVPNHVCDALLAVGGLLWTACYLLLLRESHRRKTYGMPLFALSINLGWEIVYALVVSEKLVERATFTVWLAIDCFLVYPGVLRYGREYEWNHATPLVRRYLGFWLALMGAAAVAGQYAFASWWIANNIGAKEGKFYRGKDWGPDISELGFWSAAVSQVYLSAASLAMLAVRGHSGGVSWGIW